jgi:hypothetical protein
MRKQFAIAILFALFVASAPASPDFAERIQEAEKLDGCC